MTRPQLADLFRLYLTADWHLTSAATASTSDPADAVRYKERAVAERSNARLKDEFGGRNIRVRGPDNVMSHLMFGLLALTAG